MTPILAVLRIAGRAVKRDLRSFESVKLNNLFLFVGLLVLGALESGLEPVSAEPLILLLGLLLLFPLSSDPLSKIPLDRMKSWPLDWRQQFALRLASAALSPVLWLAVAVALLTRRPAMALFFIGLAVNVQLVVQAGNLLVSSGPALHPLRWVPWFPGKLGGLIQNDIREMSCVLDPYAALLLALGGIAYRFSGLATDPSAGAILAMLVALTLSTWAQCLFGLDLPSSAMLRYQLLPLRGWEILASKDAAFCLVLLPLVLPLNPGPGLTFGLAALAVGHHTSVLRPASQQRWRFTSGRIFPGAVQIVASTMLGFAEHRHGPLILVLTAAGWVISLTFYGHLLDRRVLS